VIERVDQYKYLGIVVDHKLNWAPQVQYVKNRLRRLTYAFTQLREVLAQQQLRTVYFAYVQSVLQYGILAWGGALPSIMEPLAVSQRSIMKTILKKRIRFPTIDLFNEFQ